jgi:hypothetical protein
MPGVQFLAGARFFSSQLWDYLSSYATGTRGHYPRCKVTGHEDQHSPPTNGQLKNGRPVPLLMHTSPCVNAWLIKRKIDVSFYLQLYFIFIGICSVIIIWNLSILAFIYIFIIECETILLNVSIFAVQKICGSNTDLNCTYFTSPDFPSLYTRSERCSISVSKCNSNICQVRTRYCMQPEHFVRLSLANGKPQVLVWNEIVHLWVIQCGVVERHQCFRGINWLLLQEIWVAYSSARIGAFLPDCMASHSHCPTYSVILLIARDLHVSPPLWLLKHFHSLTLGYIHARALWISK